MLQLRIIAGAGAAVVMLAIAASTAGPASAGGGCHHGNSRDERGTAVAMSGNCFTPSVLRVEVGDTVSWHNKDDEEHTVTGADQRWGDYDPIAKVEQVSYAFDESGIFLYYCQLHPGMVGAIVVGGGLRASDVSDDGDDSAQSASASSAVNASGEPEEAAAASVSAEDGGPGLGRALAIVGGGIAALGVVALVLTRVRRLRDA